MPLVKDTLETQIKAMLNSLKTEEDQTAAVNKLAGDLATAIDAYIKSATITSVHVPALVSPAGPVTGTIATTNSIS